VKHYGFFPPPKPPEFEQDVDAMMHFVREREASRIRKEAGEPWPYGSKDPIITAWKFTNVRREDDFTTRWIKQNIRDPFADHPLLWLMLCIARTINYAPSLGKLISPDFMGGRCWPNHRRFSPEHLTAGIEELSRHGKYKSAAYKVVSNSIDERGWAKWLAEDALGPLWRHAGRFEKHFARQQTLQSTHELIYGHKHWGGEGLLAYQVVVDLRFTPVLSDAKDRKTWCATGKGTRQGLNRVYGREVDDMPPRGQLMRECIELWPIIIGETGVKCDLSDVPNILCETNKYIRTLRNEGRPKERYVPRIGPRL
jgi:hypothetical protein